MLLVTEGLLQEYWNILIIISKCRRAKWKRKKRNLKRWDSMYKRDKVGSVNVGANYIDDLKHIIETGFLKATNDFSLVRDVKFIAICVPIPLDTHQQSDISYVKSSVEKIAKFMTKGIMVVLDQLHIRND